jgi:hypothetical protein
VSNQLVPYLLLTFVLLAAMSIAYLIPGARPRAVAWVVGILIVVVIGWVTERRLDRGEPLPPPPGMVVVVTPR